MASAFQASAFQDSAFQIDSVATTPFIQDEWPNPFRGKRPKVFDHTASFPLTNTILGASVEIGGPTYVQTYGQFPVTSGISVVLRPVTVTATDILFEPKSWPNPRGRPPVPFDWERSFQLPLTTVVPFKYFYPNPMLAKNRHFDWVYGTPRSLTDTVVVGTKIERTYDWRIPQGPRRKPIVADFQNRNQLLLSSVAPLQPVTGQKTIRYSRKIATTGPNLVLTLLVGQDAFTTSRNRYDYPNPRGPRQGRQFWIQSHNFDLVDAPVGTVETLIPGCAVVGGYFSKGQWHTIIGTPCKPKKRRSWKEPGFSYQQYQDFKEAILAGEVPLSQRQVKRWYEGGAFSKAQFDDIKATIRLERETEAQRQKLEAEAKAFAEAKAQEKRLADIEAQARAEAALNELRRQGGQFEAAARLQALNHQMRISEAAAASAKAAKAAGQAELERQAKEEADDDERAIAMLFEDD